MLVAVTGANGFIGRFVCRALYSAGHRVRAVVRSPNISIVASHEMCCVGDIGPETKWSEALAGVDVVVHLAARAHILKEFATDPDAEYQRTNVEGTECLARAAAHCGVRRFIYLSSIGVLGDHTEEHPFTESDAPQPYDPYTRSKYEGECRLRNVAAAGGMETVIIRSPLVYGPNVPGNFTRLLKAVYVGMPLPLKSVMNRRSFIYVENLADFLVTCVEHEKASRETFVVADREDLSTPDLIRCVAKAMRLPARLLPCNATMMKVIAQMVGKGEVFNKLCGSLRVDSAKACELLSWSSPVSIEEGVQRTVQWFLTK